MDSTPRSRAFPVLVITQLLGAANDNLLKGILTFLVVQGAWSQSLGTGGQAVVFVAFTLPFLLFSGVAGPLADRTSKSRMAKGLKALEIPIVGVAAYGFFAQNLWVVLAAMFLLTTQSAFFGPVKYGMIPEVLSGKKLARANGMVNMTTNIAAVLATKFGGQISDLYEPMDGVTKPMTWLPGASLLGLALLGVLSALCFPALKAVAPNARARLSMFGVYKESASYMKGRPLGKIVLLWGYFYSVATFALLIIPEYATVLSVSRSRAADLLVVISVSIAVGSLGVGLLAKDKIGKRFVPIGALGMMLCFALLAIIPPTFSIVALLLGIAGLFAGTYIVPLQAEIQALAPQGDRGRFLGTANALSFSMMAATAVIYKLIRGYFGQAPYHIFWVCCAMMLVALWSMRKNPQLLQEREGTL